MKPQSIFPNGSSMSPNPLPGKIWIVSPNPKKIEVSLGETVQMPQICSNFYSGSKLLRIVINLQKDSLGNFSVFSSCLSRFLGLPAYRVSKDAQGNSKISCHILSVAIVSHEGETTTFIFDRNAKPQTYESATRRLKWKSIDVNAMCRLYISINTFKRIIKGRINVIIYN